MDSVRPERINIPDADVWLYREFFPKDQGNWLLNELVETTAWRQNKLRLYGKWTDAPRLTAWHGDAGRCYAYSGMKLVPNPWTSALLQVKARVEYAAGVAFNTVLLNLYRNGQDSVAWHSDNEPELVPDAVIGSVSFGAVRVFELRHKTARGLTRSLPLPHGSLLLMEGATQRYWLHRIPKTRVPTGLRLNLTFRVIR